MTDITMDQSLFSRLRERFPEPGAPFLQTANGRVWSYGDLMDTSGRFANALVELGVKPGDRVAVQAEKSPELLHLYLACTRAGAVYLPLNTAYTAAEVEYFLRDAEPRLVVAAPERREELEPLAHAIGARLETLDAVGGGTFMERAGACAGAFADVPRNADDLCAILYTSGTTGRAKGAMLTQHNLLSNAIALADVWRFSRHDKLLHALPIFHTHGLFVATNTVLYSGASMIFLPKFDVGEILRLLPEATSMMGVPTFYTRLLAQPGFTREAARHIRVFISGSAPLSAETHKSFAARTGHAIIERYGMTETNMNTSNPYDGERRPGTVGLSLPGVDLRVAEADSGRVLAQGEVGVIEVRGPNVCRGYWRNPEKTKAEFRADGFFITGDLGVIDERGYVAIVGREKDLIISGGYNIYPAEVEAALDALPGVAELAVIGAPDSDLGERVVAVVVATDDAGAVGEDFVRARLKGVLAHFKVPKRVFVLDQLPRNAMGKIEKAALRARYRAVFQRTEDDLT